MVSHSLWLLAGWEDVLRMVAGQPGVSPLPAVEEERGAGTRSQRSLPPRRD